MVPSKLLWNPYVPTKISFFAWEVRWGKILTMDQLKKKGFTLAIKFPFYVKEEEVMEHILIHCLKDLGIMDCPFHHAGGGSVCPFSVQDLIIRWNAFPLRNKSANLWRMIPLCLLWAIWIERNKVIFEDKLFSYDGLKAFFLQSLSSWASLISNVDYTLIRILFCIL